MKYLISCSYLKAPAGWGFMQSLGNRKWAARVLWSYSCFQALMNKILGRAAAQCWLVDWVVFQRDFEIHLLFLTSKTKCWWIEKMMRCNYLPVQWPFCDRTSQGFTLNYHLSFWRPWQVVTHWRGEVQENSSVPTFPLKDHKFFNMFFFVFLFLSAIPATVG